MPPETTPEATAPVVPRYDPVDSLPIRTSIDGVLIVNGAAGIPFLLSLPSTAVTMTSIACAAILGTVGLVDLGWQGLEKLHRIRHGCIPAGAHKRLYDAIDAALRARRLDLPDRAETRQKVLDMVRVLARRPVEHYLRIRLPENLRNDPSALRLRVNGLLRGLKGTSADRSIGSLRLEDILVELIPPLYALLEITPPSRTVGFTVSPNVNITQVEINLIPAARSNAALPVVVPAPVLTSTATPPPDPMDLLSKGMDHVPGGRRTFDEIQRMHQRVSDVSVELLSRERRHEISTLMTVHLVAMARSYARAAAIAEDADLERLRRRTLEGLLPVLGTLRDAYQECLSVAASDVDTKVRFMESRHPIVPDDLKPIG